MALNDVPPDMLYAPDTCADVAACRQDLSLLVQRLHEQERLTSQHIARSLHDHLGQALATVRMHLELLKPSGGASSVAATPTDFSQIDAMLDEAIRGVRQMMAALRPPMLSEYGLVAALKSEVQRCSHGEGAADVLLETPDTVAAVRWPADVEYHAFMIAREAIGNALQHAHATLIRVLLEGDVRKLSLEIVDDGKGMPPTALGERPPYPGIAAMRERANALGARFVVGSSPVGGTRVALLWGMHTP